MSFVVKKIFYHRVHKEHKELHKDAENVLEICVNQRILSAAISEKFLSASRVIVSRRFALIFSQIFADENFVSFVVKKYFTTECTKRTKVHVRY